MAYYGAVIAIDRPHHSALSISFELRDNSTSPHTVKMSGTMGFSIDGTKTYVENRTRLKTEFDAYMDKLIASAENIDAALTQLRSEAIGYTHPAQA